jgi:hypothetical protein
MTQPPQIQHDLSSQAVTYLAFEGAPASLRFFSCERLKATLSTASCATNWRRAHQPHAESLWRCKDCSIGANHTSATAAATIAPTAVSATTCSRHHEATGRLVNGWLCISCYNREREHRVGRNAKGKVPERTAGLTRRSIRVYEGLMARVFERDLTVDTTELVIAALRDCNQPVTFAFQGIGLLKGPSFISRGRTLGMAAQTQLSLF